MGVSTKPYYIINREFGGIEGKAHSTCRSQLSDSDKLATIPTTMYNRTPPNTEQIQFGLKTINLLIGLRKESVPVRKISMSKIILLHDTIFKVSNLKEFFDHPRTQELLDWWLNGSKIRTKDEIDEIKTDLEDYFNSFDEVQSCISTTTEGEE